MSTLVVCIDRGSPFPEGSELPVSGWDDVRSLVTDVGLDDPENSRVNTLLEGLSVTRELQEEGDDVHVAVVGDRSEGVNADRSVARQIDELIERHEFESAIVVVDSAEDERLVPIVESRLQVDAVDRVVVRQARDIESTYYLLKQFLADEQLRKNVLVPLGITLLAVPIMLLFSSPALAGGTIAAAVGVFLIYKGLGVDAYLSRLATEIQEGLYSGQVSLVTYVVAAGLALVGLFAGALGIRNTGDTLTLITAMQFAFHSVPWLTAAALAAATGRLLDELLGDESVRSAYVNLPFGAIAVGLVIRGFAGYFLERAEVYEPFNVGQMNVGPLTIDPFALDAGTRLAIYIVASLLVSIVGVRVAAYFTGTSTTDEFIE